MTEQTAVPNIYTAMNAVMEEVEYVVKSRSAGLKYSFAGEAALIEALRPAMVKNGIFVVVSEVKHVETREYQSSGGANMVNVALVAAFRFYHTSGTFVEVGAAGEASDSGDKATAKAMTAAYKYALRESFCVQTGDDPDKYASDERPAGSTTVTRPPAQAPANGNGKPAAAKVDDSAEIAAAGWSGMVKYAELCEAAHKANITPAAVTPGKTTRGELRSMYAELNAKLTAVSVPA